MFALTRSAVLAAILSVAVAAPSAGAAPIAAGELECIVDGGAGVVVGAYRNLACTYRRPGQPVERYEGYTGIIASASHDANVVIFQVSSSDPAGIAVLGGDYDARGFGPAGGTALVGGQSGAAVLAPLVNASTVSLAELNVVLGVSQLHLNFAGIDSHERRSRRRVPGAAPR